MLWESVKDEFVCDGSWRDICVPAVGLEEWQGASEAIVAAGYPGRFAVDGAAKDLPGEVGELFALRSVASPVWSVFVSGVQLNCHFFDEAEIEFDLDPREVVGQAELDGLLCFMAALSAATRRAALMTPENMHEVPFIRVEPSGVAEYISPNPARGRL